MRSLLGRFFENLFHRRDPLADLPQSALPQGYHALFYGFLPNLRCQERS